MFKPIDITTDGYENITLFDTHDITINRKNGNNAELVIHPCAIGKLSIRLAKEPYQCRIILANGEDFSIDLGDEDDWGNVQEFGLEGKLGWGNEEDGHTEIVKVELLDGYPNGTDIPLDEFKQDVKDFTIYYEG